MQIFTKNYDIPFNQNKQFRDFFKGNNIAILDIETTGLSPKFCKVILVGIIIISKDNQKLYQIFADSQEEEKDLLLKTKKILEDVDFVITYNGKKFDLPFLKERSSKNKLDFPSLYNLDLYLLAKGFTDLPSFLPNLKQKTVEKLIIPDYKRKDEISGGDSVKLYNQYEVMPSKELLRQILLHNYEDICLLHKLIKLVNLSDFSGFLMKYGFFIKNKKGNPLILTDIKIEKNHLLIEGLLDRKDDFLIFPSIMRDIEGIFRENGEFSLKIYFCEEENSISIIDISKLLSKERLKELSKAPNIYSDYLVVKNKKDINNFSILLFLKAFCEDGFSYEIY